MRARSGIPPARAPAQLTKGKGYASDRSREGPHPSSSGRWPAERGRRRAGAAGLARSKGPPAPRDDDGRGQIANFARPRSRPHGLISAAHSHRPRYPAADGDGADSVRAAASGGHGRCRKKNPADGGAQVLGRTNSEGRRVRSASTNAQPRAGFRAFHKKFFGGSPPGLGRMRLRLDRRRPSLPGLTRQSICLRTTLPLRTNQKMPGRRRCSSSGAVLVFREKRHELRPSFSSGPVSH
jgi:hypothetical protein